MATDIMAITREPLTNDEIAGLIIGGNGANAQMLTAFIQKFENYITATLKEQAATSAEIINNQSLAMRKLEDSLTAQSQTIEKLENIITNMNYSTGNFLHGECHLVQRMPERIRMDCIALAPNKSPRVTFRRILKKMNEISSIDIDAYILKNSCIMKYANFAKSYFISKDDILFAVYKKAVEELKNNSEV